MDIGFIGLGSMGRAMAENIPLDIVFEDDDLAMGQDCD